MGDTLLLIAVFVAAYAGFGFLALSQDKPWQQLTDAEPCPARLVSLFRTVGIGLLIVALGAALLRDGPAFGSLLWAVAISLAAMLVVFTLSSRPLWLRSWLNRIFAKQPVE